MSKKIVLKLKLIFIPCSENSYRPKFLESKFLFYYLIFLFLLKLTLFFYLIYIPKSIFFADLSGITLIKLTNQERQVLGLNPLIENPQLSSAAYSKAQDMMEKDYFSHLSPEGRMPWYWIQKADYDYQYAGENLAIGFLEAEEVYEAWKDSPTHKANLFNLKYKDTGVAVLKGDFEGGETFVVVQLFGLSKTGLKEQPIDTKEEITQEEKQEQIEKESVLVKEPADLKDSSSPVFISYFEEEKKDDFSFNFFRFLSENYNKIVQNLIFFSLFFITVALLLNVFIKFDVQHGDLIGKTLFFVVLLILFVLFDKELMIHSIPHNFSIY